MRHYVASQRVSDQRWDYTCNRHPTGYCCEYRPISLDGIIGEHLARRHNEQMEPLKDNFHTTGHATRKEAEDCYKKYLLDTQLSLLTSEPPNAQQQHKCMVCGTWTACFAHVGTYRLFVLCPEHQTREAVESLLEVGESWES